MTPSMTSQKTSQPQIDGDQTRDHTEPFARMMRLGHACYTQGARKQAHRYWRRAALIEPGNEMVWLSLLNVVDTDEDRRVCLENIVAINPHNKEALAQLGLIDPSPLDSPITVVLRVVWALLLAIFIAVAIAVIRTMV